MKQFSLWLIGLFAFTVISSSAHAQQVYGELKVVKGDVNIKSGRDSKVTKAAIGLRVFPTDTIVTGKDSRAKILMVDKNEINISPDSEIVLQKYVYDPANGKKEVLLNVLSGKVRAKVEQKYDGKAATFHVKTPSAVAGVRGTDFLTSFDSKTNQSSVVTFHGRVEFGQPGAGGTIQNPVMVTPGQVSVASAGAAPSTPVAMPKQQLASMEKESNADTASAAAPKDSASDSRQPSSSDEKKKEEGSKNENSKGGEKESGNGPKTAGTNPDKGRDRNPDSVPGGGNDTPRDIIKPGDVIGGDGGGGGACGGGPCPPPPPIVVNGGGGACGGGPCPPPPPPEFKCDFCNQTIQNGNSKLLINISTQ